ncbi:MAG TPA: amino acid adenylation domain-containing protein [Pyrinomonadaceae bacterium]
MADVSNRIASLTPQERAALVMQRKRKAQAARKVVDHAITRRNRSEAPLSFAQQRLWFLQQLDPGSAAYHLLVFYRLKGQLDVAAWEQSLNEIVRRHEVLRTVFRESNSEPVQVVLTSLHISLPVVDLTVLSRPDADRETERIFETVAASPFSLHDGPLLRPVLLKFSDDEHGFYLVIHHIVTDGWSMDIFMSELGTLYDAFATGKSSPLPELPLQYADFAAWQHEETTRNNLEAQLAYWKRQLSGDLPVLEFPTDHPRPLRMTHAGADEWFDVTKYLTEKLNDLSRREGATLFMTLFAAFLTLLHRYTGQQDILLGTVNAGRNHAQIEPLIGFFINTLVLRTDLSGNPTFRELLRRVREVALGAYEHQDVPFEKLVEELQPQRDQSHQPFTQMMFNLQAAAEEEPAARGLKVMTQDIGNQTRFDFEFHLWIVPEGLAGPLVYNTDLFEQATIVRLLGHFQTLLEGIAANPDTRLSDLPLLTKEELRQSREWNRTRSEYERDLCVHQLVEAEAARRPEAEALTYGQKQLTYGQLNERANQLAHYLLKRDAGLEARVGVLLEPSIEFVVALLAILKAGGSYVPLDPGYPKPRLEFMLEDAGVQMLLTTTVQVEVNEGTQVVYLDETWKQFAGESRENPPTQTTAENLAYVMYTSGSTGQPKGSAITHRAINRLVRNTNYVQLNESDRVAQVSNVSFDAATFEIWGALTNGATLVGLPKDTVLSPPEFKHAIATQKVSVMFLTTALFNQVAQNEPDAFAPLRYLLFGGETCDAEAVRRVLQSGKPQHLHHVYGPTEATTFSSSYEINEVAAGARTLPIGRAISNTELWVLDQCGQVAPVGVPGELYIGGDGIARAYLGCPELTAEKFVPHPYSAEPGARLYRTGDLVRYLSDGNIDILGRMDQQVKLRGFRVELGEIETVLQQHPLVRESVVVFREDAPGEKRLAAYVVGDSQTIPAAQLIAELRIWLRQHLPDYFVPAHFVVLDNLPLTPNGKVDRRALPAPDHSEEPEFIAPRTPEEATIAEIWADILDISPIGVETNFFDLGGHSLLATRIVTRIREAFCLDLPLRVLFEFPTIAGVAEHVVSARAQGELSHLAEIINKLTQLSEDETQSMLQKTAGQQEF